MQHISRREKTILSPLVPDLSRIIHKFSAIAILGVSHRKQEPGRVPVEKRVFCPLSTSEKAH